MVVKDSTPAETVTTIARQLPPIVQEAAERVLNSVDPVLDREDLRALVARLLNALAEVTEALQDLPKEEVLAAPTDREALVRALLATPPSGTSDVEVEAQRLRDQARLRGALARDRLLQIEGGVVSGAKAASLLGASRQTVNTRRNKGTLIGLKVGRQGHVYPMWQFTSPGTLTGLEDVLGVLRRFDPWTQAAFMVNENSRLGGRRPLDLLRAREVMPVVEAAHAYGEQGGT